MNLLPSSSKILAAAILGFGLIGPAHAGLVTFDFTSGGPFGTAGTGSHAYTYNTGGVNLTVEAFATDDFGSGFTKLIRNIRNGANGLGNAGFNGAKIDNIPDGLPPKAEWLSFSADVGEIVSVGIWNLANSPNSNPEEADFWRQAAPDFTGAFQYIDTLFGVAGTNPQTQSVDLMSFPWLVVATGNEPSSFRVSSVTVDVPSQTEVPEPGTLALFGFGLAGLGFARRRRAA